MEMLYCSLIYEINLLKEWRHKKWRYFCDVTPWSITTIFLWIYNVLILIFIIVL